MSLAKKFDEAAMDEAAPEVEKRLREATGETPEATKTRDDTAKGWMGDRAGIEDDPDLDMQDAENKPSSGPEQSTTVKTEPNETRTNGDGRGRATSEAGEGEEAEREKGEPEGTAKATTETAEE